MLTEESAPELVAIASPDRESPERALDRLVLLATRVVPGCRAALLCVWDAAESLAGTRLVTASHPGLDLLFGRQYERGGPALAAHRTGHSVAIGDMLREDRWPGYAAGACHLGIRSVLAVPHAKHRRITLSLYATRPHALNEDSAAPMVSLLLTHAADVVDDAFT